MTQNAFSILFQRVYVFMTFATSSKMTCRQTIFDIDPQKSIDSSPVDISDNLDHNLKLNQIVRKTM